jgi:hypothetical protein
MSALSQIKSELLCMKSDIRLKPSVARQASSFTLTCFLIVSAFTPARGVDVFAENAPLANRRQSHTATLLRNGKVLVVGGHRSFNPIAVAELFDPVNAFDGANGAFYGLWADTGSLATARYAHTATMLPNGKVLVVGGYNSSGTAIGSGELYDPQTGTWSATGGLATGRAFHTTTTLANGKVLIVGGQNAGGPLATAELYDPATGTWSVTGSMAVPRQAHTATLLPNGLVLAAGGADGFGTFFTSAEIYNPSTGTWSATGSSAVARAFHMPSFCRMERYSSLGANDRL